MKKLRTLDNRGQVRLMESVLATAVMTIALIIIMNLTIPLRSIYLRETSDLRRLAYNVLNSLSDTGVFEDIIIGGMIENRTWEDELSLFFSLSLPPNVLFKVDVYEFLILENGTTRWVKLNAKPITNLVDWKNIKLVEAEAITYTYVCVLGPDEGKGTFLKIDMVIGYGG